MSSPKRLKLESSEWKGPREQEWLEFEKVLGLASASNHTQQQVSGKFDDKICVIGFYCYYDDNRGDEIGYCIYRIDIKSPPPPPLTDTVNTTPLHPILWWNLDYRFEAFAVLGSDLFMFGENCRPDEFAYPRLYNCVSIYNIGPALSCPDTMQPNCINLRTTPPTGTGPRMKGCKFSPVAVVLGDFKICVFGKILSSDSKDVFFPPTFEILDTKNRKWTSLPEIPFNHSVYCHVQSHCVRGSCLIIQTIPYGIYGINVDYHKPQWVKLDQSDNIGIDHFCRIEENWTMVGKTLCSPFCAITRVGLGFQDISFEAPEWRESLIFPYYEQRKGQLLHSDELGLCIVRTGLNYLLVDIVKLDHEALETLGGSDDLSGWKNIKSNKSFTFELTSHPWNFLDSIIGCFPIKVPSAPATLSNQPFVGSHELGFQNQLWSFVINKSTKKCSHCGYTNHTVEYCFKIHGFPPGFKGKKVEPVSLSNEPCAGPDNLGTKGGYSAFELFVLVARSDRSEEDGIPMLLKIPRMFDPWGGYSIIGFGACLDF